MLEDVAREQQQILENQQQQQIGMHYQNNDNESDEDDDYEEDEKEKSLPTYNSGDEISNDEKPLSLTKKKSAAQPPPLVLKGKQMSCQPQSQKSVFQTTIQQQDNDQENLFDGKQTHHSKKKLSIKDQHRFFDSEKNFPFNSLSLKKDLSTQCMKPSLSNNSTDSANINSFQMNQIAMLNSNSNLKDPSANSDKLQLNNTNFNDFLNDSEEDGDDEFPPMPMLSLNKSKKF